MPNLDTALIVLAGIALFAAFVNGAIGYGFSSLTVTLAPTITRLLNRYERPSYIPSVGGKEIRLNSAQRIRARPKNR